MFVEFVSACRTDWYLKHDLEFDTEVRGRMNDIIDISDHASCTFRSRPLPAWLPTRYGRLPQSAARFLLAKYQFFLLHGSKESTTISQHVVSNSYSYSAGVMSAIHRTLSLLFTVRLHDKLAVPRRPTCQSIVNQLKLLPTKLRFKQSFITNKKLC